MSVLLPEVVWRGGRFQHDLAVAVDGATGRIVEVMRAADAPDDAVHLRGRALLPGFVNAHSHAFQRLIRGRTQWRPADRPKADFWSWREAMYAAALGLSADEVEAVSRFCFVEMLRAGWTTVGEFHYLHTQPDGTPYEDPNELAHRVLRAAAAVGIRIVLLNVAYATGGIGTSLHPEQRRFATPDLEAFQRRTEALAAWAGEVGRSGLPGGALATVGVAPHSVRAVPRPWLAELAGWARGRRMPFHVHAAEQPAEVEAAVAAYGARPVALLAADGVLDPAATVVHATHLDDAEIRALGESGATVCACPSTERDLGDGILPAAALLDAGVSFAFGTDSQSVIDPFDEMRSLEYHERLRALRRVTLVAAGDRRLDTPPVLLRAATEGGARSLRVDAGRVEPGALADLVAVDLRHRALAGWSPGTLPALLALAAPQDVVTDVWVGGVRRVENRAHALEVEAADAFTAVARRLEGED